MNFDFNKKGYCVVSFGQLAALADIIIESKDNRDRLIIDKLLNNLKVTLVSEYDTDIQLLVNDINNIKGLINGYYDCGSNVYRILEQSEISKKNIKS